MPYSSVSIVISSDRKYMLVGDQLVYFEETDLVSFT